MLSARNALTVEDHSSYSIGLALLAASHSIPYIPTRSLLGSDILRQTPTFRAETATDGTPLLQSYHPGSSIEAVQQQTGWPLRLAPDCAETVPPGADELRLIRECDPQRVWTA